MNLKSTIAQTLNETIKQIKSKIIFYGLVLLGMLLTYLPFSFLYEEFNENEIPTPKEILGLMTVLLIGFFWGVLIIRNVKNSYEPLKTRLSLRQLAKDYMNFLRASIYIVYKMMLILIPAGLTIMISFALLFPKISEKPGMEEFIFGTLFLLPVFILYRALFTVNMMIFKDEQKAAIAYKKSRQWVGENKFMALLLFSSWIVATIPSYLYPNTIAPMQVYPLALNLLADVLGIFSLTFITVAYIHIYKSGT